MNLDAIKIGLKSSAQKAAENTALRNRSAGHGNLMFRDTAPVVAAVAKVLGAEPVKPVALPGSDIVAAVKALVAPVTAALEMATATIATPKAARLLPPHSRLPLLFGTRAIRHPYRCSRLRSFSAKPKHESWHGKAPPERRRTG